MNLGIVYENGKVCSHRSLLKVCINPFLRTIGLEIATLYYPQKKKLSIPIIHRCIRKKLKFSFDYKLDKDMYLVKKRTFI